MLQPLTLACLLTIAGWHGLPPPILVAVLGAELGHVGEISRNANGTFDSGPMQVNSVWLGRLARRYALSEGKVAELLRDDGCFNADAAAFILRRCIDRNGGDLWTGVGCYHSATPARRTAYQQRVLRKLVEIYAPDMARQAAESGRG
jgi:hypothetical protein